MAGADVVEPQDLLGGLGYQLPDDGVYGPETGDQVRQFQEHRRLGVDGVFGPVTFRELSRVRELAESAGQAVLLARLSIFGVGGVLPLCHSDAS